MDENNYKHDSVYDIQILALWMYYHPNHIVTSCEKQYVYDRELNCFLFRKPSNRIRNKWQRAKALDAWLSRAICDNVKLL